jgi:transcriptional regulator with XRE-family HTH domain
MDVGALLRDTRLERGLDQAELARRAGTTQPYVSRVERGAISPSPRTLERLFHAMGRRLALTTEPLPTGNVSPRELRADFSGLTAAERVEQAMELSEFLTDVAADARTEASRGTG